MSDLKTSLNSLGLLVTLVGIGLLYISSPLNAATLDGGGFNTKPWELERVTDKRNA